MSNYYKNGVSLSTLCKGITTSNYGASFNSLGLTLVTIDTVSSTTAVNEKPNNLGYLLNGTDISTYCIAPYVESTGTNNYSSIPSWCSGIRTVLIGGGGTGTAGSVGTVGTNAEAYQINYTAIHYDHKDNKGGQSSQNNWGPTVGVDINFPPGHNSAHTDNSNYQQKYVNYNTTHSNFAGQFNQQKGADGAGGGGGAFIYLNNIPVQSNNTQIQIQAGGANQGSKLTLGGTASVIYTAGAGGNATGSTVGAAGSYSIQGTNPYEIVNAGGSTASTRTGGSSGFYQYSSSFASGNGGNGTSGVGAGETVTSAVGGQAGYYRIYFLTN